LNNIPAYETALLGTRTKKVQYLFESRGNRTIIKAIEYTPVRRFQGRTIYNLGFGDYNEESGQMLDDVNSNNGDMRRVFSTVLNTIPRFFKEHPNTAIWIQGSDSEDDFRKSCEDGCKKKCTHLCKNFNRRIKMYTYYIDRNFTRLAKEYILFGFNDAAEPSSMQYIAGNEYTAILIYRKK
jgi:hypothetical protein